MNAVPMALVASLICASLIAPAVAQPVKDEFYWLDRMNRASTIMLREQNIVTPALAADIARAIDGVQQQSTQPGFKRTGDFLAIEPLLIQAGGAEVSRIHSGRSRIDLGRTSRRMQQRDDLLTTYGALIEARRTMLTFAHTHANAIVPAYTLGVQAQPISMGHYMTGYTAVYERQAELLEQTFDNLNRSPLGAGALGTSSFPIDRVRLATLLGFDAPVRNSFDAVQLSTVDSSMRVVGATSSLAMTTGELMSDLEAQYRLLKPWLTLPSGDMVGGSSMMPQKRNPDIINETRALASEVLGKGATYMFMAHNLPHGFPREQASTPPSEALSTSTRMLRNVAQLFAAFQFDEKRALEEVLSEYSTTTELADMLQRDADMPFRDGHHFASELVNYGRSKGLRPIDIPYEAAQKLFTQLAVEHGAVNKTLPLSAAEFRRALSPQNMVSASRGLGGPQPAEVAAMLKEQEQHLADSTTWLKQKLDKLATADAELDRDFNALRK